MDLAIISGSLLQHHVTHPEHQLGWRADEMPPSNESNKIEVLNLIFYSRLCGILLAKVHNMSEEKHFGLDSTA